MKEYVQSRPLWEIPAGNEYVLSGRELEKIEKLICEFKRSFNSVESDKAALAAEALAARLPREILAILRYIASGESRFGFFNLRGFDLNDEEIGDSPHHWDQPWDARPYLREEVYQILISSAIGGVFGWRTQENGRFLRHIIPIKNVEKEQLGGSSATELVWHTEEAFHVGKADFFTLMCYRNNESATTNLSFFDDLNLSPDIIEVLRQPRFYILPDKSHTPDENIGKEWNLNMDAFEIIKDMVANPQPTSLVYGRHDIPLMRIDQAFSKPIEGDQQAAKALSALHDELSRAATRQRLHPGDVVIIDNLRSAHGRSIYKPDYGPKQRWMRRVNIANGRRHHLDLRDAKNIRVML